MNARIRSRAVVAVAGAGALAALTGGLAQAATPENGADTPAGTESAGTAVHVLDGVPELPLPQEALTPVDLAAPVYGLLGGLS